MNCCTTTNSIIVMGVAGTLFLLSAQSIAVGQGGDLPSGAAIFRPKNPETKSKRRTDRQRVSKPPTARRTTSREALTPNVNAGERIEDDLDAGNEARDNRLYADSEKAYRSVLRLNPRDSRAFFGLGNVYTDQQRWEEAEKAYRQAASLGPNNVDLLIALSYVLVQPRSGAGNAGRLADAEQAARRAIGIQPENAIAHDRLGSALEARALTGAETEQEYRRAIAIDSNFAVAYVHLARLLRRLNRPTEADPLYARAIEMAKDAPTLVLVADALQSEQRWGDSEPVLRRALSIDGRNPNALFLLAKLMVVRKQYSEAEPLLRTVIDITPRSFAPYFVLGSAYLRMDRANDADQIFSRASQIATAGDRKQLAGGFGFAGVGDAYLKAGNTAAAVRAYQRALDLDPNDAELKSKLEKAREQVKP